jgi:hypothetical protein
MGARVYLAHHELSWENLHIALEYLVLKTLIKCLLMNTNETDQWMIMMIHCSTPSSHNIKGPLDSTIHMV